LGARAPRLSQVVHFKAPKRRGLRTAVTGDAPPLMGLPCLSEVRAPHLAALWFAAPSLPFLRLRGVRCWTPSGTAAPAAPTDLGDPPGYDPATIAAAPRKRDGRLPEVPHPYSGHDLPESTVPGDPTPGPFRPRRFSRPRRITPPTGSRSFSGRCRSWGSPFRALLLPDSRTPLGVVTLVPFLETAVLHSEVIWKITVLRSYRVLLRPVSPYPAGLPPRRQADALLGFRLSRALAGTPWSAPPPTFPHALRLRRASRKTGRRLCLRASICEPVRGSVSGPPALLRFST